MFIRFRTSSTGRLGVSIAQTRRINGTVRQSHVASLGSVVLDRAETWVTVRERREMWQALHECVGRLSLDDATASKLMTALQERVPLPTVEESGAAELAEAEDDAAFWDRMHGTSMKQVESYQDLIATAERRMGEERENAKREAENAEQAKAKAPDSRTTGAHKALDLDWSSW